MCRDANHNITSVSLLDYYEARVQRGIQVQLPDDATPERIAIAALGTVERFSKVRGENYREFVQGFMAQVNFVEGLVNIPDSDNIVLPENCTVEQLIVNQAPQFPEDKRFHVNLPLWSHMSNGQKAGAILHEAFYSEAIANGAEDSRAARYFHSKMVAVTAPQMTDFEYLQAASLAGFPEEDFKNLFLSHGELTSRFSRSGELKFSPEGALTDITRPVNSTPIHPLLNSLAPQRSLHLVVGTSGTAVRYDLTGGYAQMELNGHFLSLKENSSVIIGADQSLEFQLAMNNDDCYSDPEGKAYCGKKLVVDIQGKVIAVKNSLADLSLPGWVFRDSSSQVTWTVAENGIIIFSGMNGQATYSGPNITLVFGSLTNLRISSDLVPFVEGSVGIPLDPSSTFYGVSLGRSPRLISPMAKPFPGSISAEDARSVQAYFEKEVEIEGLSGALWRQDQNLLSTTPQESLSWNVSDFNRTVIAISSKAGTKVSKVGNDVYFTVGPKFRRQTIHCAPEEKGYPRQVSIGPGDQVIANTSVWISNESIEVNGKSCYHFSF